MRPRTARATSATHPRLRLRRDRRGRVRPARRVDSATIGLADCRCRAWTWRRAAGVHDLEDREARSGRRIAAALAVVRRGCAGAEPDPIVILAGGPARWRLAPAQCMPLFTRLNDTRDVASSTSAAPASLTPLDCEDESQPLAVALSRTACRAPRLKRPRAQPRRRLRAVCDARAMQDWRGAHGAWAIRA